MSPLTNRNPVRAGPRVAVLYGFIVTVGNDGPGGLALGDLPCFRRASTALHISQEFKHKNFKPFPTPPVRCNHGE